jgi:hypothetical protein
MFDVMEEVFEPFLCVSLIILAGVIVIMCVAFSHLNGITNTNNNNTNNNNNNDEQLCLM